MAGTRAVIYARLSITRDESVSIERQLERSRAYCQARGWEVVAEHVDDGVSASARAPEDRKGWKALLAMPPGSFDVVVVWKVDRLSRRVIDFLNAHKALEERNAAVTAVDDPIDMSTAQGRAFATMLAVFAEMEADGIASRVRDARKHVIKQGRVAGGAAPFGYMNSANKSGAGKVLAKNPDTISYVEEAASRVLAGRSLSSVAAYLDEVAPRSGRQNSASHWTVTTTKRMLANPVLAGMTLHNPGLKSKERGSGVLRGADGMPVIRHDLAVLNVEEFRKLERRLGERQGKSGATESYLSGLVWCGRCHKKMYRNAKTVRGERVTNYQCQGKSGCGQQVSRLEAIVEQRFLEEFGNAYSYRLVEVPSDYDHVEIDHQISETAAAMTEHDADLETLLERLRSLKELRKRSVGPNIKVERSMSHAALQWKDDPRATLLGHVEGVQLTKGKVGRKFDQSRLSWIPKAQQTFDSLGGAMEAAGMTVDEKLEALRRMRTALEEGMTPKDAQEGTSEPI